MRWGGTEGEEERKGCEGRHGRLLSNGALSVLFRRCSSYRSALIHPASFLLLHSSCLDVTLSSCFLLHSSSLHLVFSSSVWSSTWLSWSLLHSSSADRLTAGLSPRPPHQLPFIPPLAGQEVCCVLICRVGFLQSPA